MWLPERFELQNLEEAAAHAIAAANEPLADVHEIRVAEVQEGEAEEENGSDDEEEQERIEDSESDEIERQVPEEGPISFEPRFCTETNSSDLRRRCRI